MSLLLSFLIAFPLLAGLAVVAFSDRDDASFPRWAALVVAVTNAVASLGLLTGATRGPAGTMLAGFEEKRRWIEAFGISYHLRVDGFSTFLIILASFATAVAVAASWRAIQQRAAVYYGCLLMLAGGMIGVLAAADLFLFYVFWEIMLIPAFFLVGVFGGSERRAAVLKFVIYTMVGSLLMLVGVVFLGWQHLVLRGAWSFSLDALQGLPYTNGPATWAFLTFLLAFGIKAALFPFHTWLPLTYSQAPMPVTFLLSAVMAKLGIYGLLRIALPLFPDAAQAAMPVLAGLAVAGVIYAAFAALAQDDARLVVAYASISHLGVILLGTFSLTQQAVSGAVFHLVGHALTTGAMFLVVGFMAERTGSTRLADWGGAARVMPWFATFFMVLMLGAVGLPGLSAFVGEFLIFAGAFAVHKAATGLALTSIVLGAAYMLWWYQRVMFGPLERPELAALPDLSLREGATLASVLLAVIALGVYPQPVIAAINPVAARHLAVFGLKADPAPASAPTKLAPPAPGHGGHGGAGAPSHGHSDGAAGHGAAAPAGSDVAPHAAGPAALVVASSPSR
ncbi:MAG: NADH-quinone oxidoreductase subunit M [Candidatus Sericytochromatia bacterium]|nr:NADH-quinone oxidoreductase subunit M [Candidatus Sericytochromatia bacterium]